jgi:hypothetical protein
MSRGSAMPLLKIEGSRRIAPPTRIRLLDSG